MPLLPIETLSKVQIAMQNFCVIENGQLANTFQHYVEVSGSFNYFLCIEIKRKPGTTNSSIALTPFSRADRNIAIAAKYRWLQLGKETQYNLNMTANFYQLSPRDIERVVEATVFPFEEGFVGECTVRYGPIMLDPVVQGRLTEAVRHNYLDINCDGGTRRSSFRFDSIQADKDEIHCNDRQRNKVVDAINISKDVITDPSQVDSLQMRVVAPGNGIPISLRGHY